MKRKYKRRVIKYVGQGHWIGECSPEEYFGFVYLIIDLVTEKKYIGKKQYWKPAYKSPKSRSGNKLSEKWKDAHWKQSDWRTYAGSSRKLTEDIEKNRHPFLMIVLSQHYSRSELHYAEVERQVMHNVLRAELPNGEKEYYNGQIAATKFIPQYPYTEEHISNLSKSCSRYHSLKWEGIDKFRKDLKNTIGKYNSGVLNGRADTKKYTFVHSDGTQFVGTRSSLCGKYNLPPKNISKLVLGVNKTSFGWHMKTLKEVI